MIGLELAFLKDLMLQSKISYSVPRVCTKLYLGYN